jgi:D-alanyl-D-alanine carboxypeptidase
MKAAIPPFPALLMIVLTIILCPDLLQAAGARAAPEFSQTTGDLRAMTSRLPRSVQERIVSGRREFLHLLSQVLDEPAELLVLVDKTHPLPPGYAPPDLVSLNGHQLSVSRTDLELRASIMTPALEMAAAARAEGAILLFSSSYRSFDYQKSVYEREVQQYGQAVADRESARPGTSQHQLGTAIDFGSITDSFADTKAGKWLASHAGEYGFSLSYPQGYEEATGYRHESWHYRFVGVPAARMQKEYFDDIQQYMLEFLHENRTALEAKRLPAR